MIQIYMIFLSSMMGRRRRQDYFPSPVQGSKPHHRWPDRRIITRGPMALPPGTTLLPATLVNTIDTSNAAWNPSSPDPSGVDYLALTRQTPDQPIAKSKRCQITLQGKNVFQSTTSGTLGRHLQYDLLTGEPTGVAINPNNNHIFISDDNGENDKVFEVSLDQMGILHIG